MRTLLNVFVVLIVFVVAVFAGAVAPPLRAENFPLVVNTPPLSPEEQRQKFHLPDGFEIQLVAAEPDCPKPINLHFDAAGKLYFTQSVEYPFAVAGDKKGRDQVRVIDEFDKDGRAASVRPFIEGLNIPIGFTTVKDGALVFSVPNTYRCSQPDDKGILQQRDILIGPFGHKDTHGLNNGFTRWIDGWIYAAHGFANSSTVAGKDKQPVTMTSGNTYRFRPDGSRVEHLTHGQVNPFGLCFDEWGNLFSADCHSMPAYQLLRGAWYPSFGTTHDGLGLGPTIMNHSHGSTAISGIVYYEADHFPPEFRRRLFIGNPVTHRINQDTLELHGSTYRAIEQPDFLKCDDPWFRPVDLKLGPDGALYIADFYNRIIGHYEVPLTHPGRDRERGRIWRIVYRGANAASPSPTVVRADKADVAELLKLLGHANLTVRTQAVHQLVDRIGATAGPELRKLLADGAASATQRAFAIWAAERIESLDDEQMLSLLKDEQPLVRAHALKALAERANDGREGPALAAAIRGRCSDPSPFVGRAAAEALAKRPHYDNLRPLLAAWRGTDKADTHRIHVIRIALRDQLLADVIYESMRQHSQEIGEADEIQLADVSLGAATPASAAFVLEYLRGKSYGGERLAEFVKHAARHAEMSRLTDVYKLLDRFRDDPRHRIPTLKAIQQGLQERGQKMPPELLVQVVSTAQALLSKNDEAAIQDGLQLARETKAAELFDPLAKMIAENPFPKQRLAAMDACAAADPQRAVSLMLKILATGSETREARQKAAQTLGAIGGEPVQDGLSKLLPTLPERLAVEAAAALAAQPPGAERLLTAAQEGKVSPRVLQEPAVEQRLKSHKLPNVNERWKQLTANLPPRDQRINELIRQRLAGFAAAKTNAAHGQEVFVKSCAACHKIAGVGAKIGPELDGLGNRGVERIIEDTLDPNRNVDQAFRSTTLTLKDGKVFSGLALREEGEILILADNQGKEVRIARTEIDQRQASQLSPMPSNIAEGLPAEDFYDLVAYLLAQQPKP